MCSSERGALFIEYLYHIRINNLKYLESNSQIYVHEGDFVIGLIPKEIINIKNTLCTRFFEVLKFLFKVLRLAEFFMLK